MCPICGGGGAALNQSLLAANDRLASQNRKRCDQHGVLAIHIMSSTAAGSAALLDATIAALGNRYRIAIVGGNYRTIAEGHHIFGRSTPPVHVRTVQARHACAELVHDVLQELPLSGIDILFFETVGSAANSAGPGAGLGLHRNVTLLSAADSRDQMSELLHKLRDTDLAIISKGGMLEVLPDMDPAQAAVALRMLGRRSPVIQSVSQRARLLAPWLQWIDAQLRTRRSKLKHPASLNSEIAFT